MGASDELRADPDVVLASVLHSGEFLKYASRELRLDRDFILTAVSKPAGGWALADDCLPELPNDILEDRQIVLAAVSTAPWVLQHLPHEMCGDREIILAALRTDGSVLHLASDALRGDLEVVSAAVCQAGRSIVSLATP